MTLKSADGELKISALLQAWTVADDAARGAGTDDLGNATGIGAFRIRRAGIELYGTVTPAWGFDVAIGPARTRTFSSRADDEILQDLAITWLGLKGHEFSLGQKNIPPRKASVPLPRSTSPSAPASPGSSATSDRRASSTRAPTVPSSLRGSPSTAASPRTPPTPPTGSSSRPAST